MQSKNTVTQGLLVEMSSRKIKSPPTERISSLDSGRPPIMIFTSRGKVTKRSLNNNVFDEENNNNLKWRPRSENLSHLFSNKDSGSDKHMNGNVSSGKHNSVTVSSSGSPIRKSAPSPPFLQSASPAYGRTSLASSRTTSLSSSLQFLNRTQSIEADITSVSTPPPLIPAPKSFLERQSSLSSSTTSLPSTKQRSQKSYTAPLPPPPPQLTMISQEFASDLSLPPPPSDTDNDKEDNSEASNETDIEAQLLSPLKTAKKSRAPEPPATLPPSHSPSPPPFPPPPPLSPSSSQIVVSSSSSSSASSSPLTRFKFPPPPSSPPPPLDHPQVISSLTSASVSSSAVLSPHPDKDEDNKRTMSPTEVMEYFDEAIGDQMFSTSTLNDAAGYPEFSPAFHFPSVSDEKLHEPFSPVTRINDQEDQTAEEKEIKENISSLEYSTSDHILPAQVIELSLSPKTEEERKKKGNVNLRNLAVSKLTSDVKTVRQYIKPGTVDELTNLFANFKDEQDASPANRGKFDFNIRETLDTLESLDKGSEDKSAILRSRERSSLLSQSSVFPRLQNSASAESLNKRPKSDYSLSKINQSPRLYSTNSVSNVFTPHALPDHGSTPGFDFLSASREIHKHVILIRSNSRSGTQESSKADVLKNQSGQIINNVPHPNTLITDNTNSTQAMNNELQSDKSYSDEMTLNHTDVSTYLSVISESSSQEDSFKIHSNSGEENTESYNIALESQLVSAVPVTVATHTDSETSSRKSSLNRNHEYTNDYTDTTDLKSEINVAATSSNSSSRSGSLNTSRRSSQGILESFPGVGDQAFTKTFEVISTSPARSGRISISDSPKMTRNSEYVTAGSDKASIKSGSTSSDSTPKSSRRSSQASLTIENSAIEVSTEHDKSTLDEILVTSSLIDSPEMYNKSAEENNTVNMSEEIEHTTALSTSSSSSSGSSSPAGSLKRNSISEDIRNPPLTTKSFSTSSLNTPTNSRNSSRAGSPTGNSNLENSDSLNVALHSALIATAQDKIITSNVSNLSSSERRASNTESLVNESQNVALDVDVTSSVHLRRRSRNSSRSSSRTSSVKSKINDETDHPDDGIPNDVINVVPCSSSSSSRSSSFKRKPQSEIVDTDSHEAHLESVSSSSVTVLTRSQEDSTKKTSILSVVNTFLQSMVIDPDITAEAPVAVSYTSIRRSSQAASLVASYDQDELKNYSDMDMKITVPSSDKSSVSSRSSISNQATSDHKTEAFSAIANAEQADNFSAVDVTCSPDSKKSSRANSEKRNNLSGEEKSDPFTADLQNVLTSMFTAATVSTSSSRRSDWANTVDNKTFDEDIIDGTVILKVVSSSSSSNKSDRADSPVREYTSDKENTDVYVTFTEKTLDFSAASTPTSSRTNSLTFTNKTDALKTDSYTLALENAVETTVITSVESSRRSSQTDLIKRDSKSTDSSSSSPKSSPDNSRKSSISGSPKRRISSDITAHDYYNLALINSTAAEVEVSAALASNTRNNSDEDKSDQSSASLQNTFTHNETLTANSIDTNNFLQNHDATGANLTVTTIHELVESMQTQVTPSDTHASVGEGNYFNINDNEVHIKLFPNNDGEGGNNSETLLTSGGKDVFGSIYGTTANMTKAENLQTQSLTHGTDANNGDEVEASRMLSDERWDTTSSNTFTHLHSQSGLNDDGDSFSSHADIEKSGTSVSNSIIEPFLNIVSEIVSSSEESNVVIDDETTFNKEETMSQVSMRSQFGSDVETVNKLQDNDDFSETTSEDSDSLSGDKNVNSWTVTQSEDDVSKISGMKIPDSWQVLRERLDSFSGSNIAVTHDEKESSDLVMYEPTNGDVLDAVSRSKEHNALIDPEVTFIKEETMSQISMRSQFGSDLETANKLHDNDDFSETTSEYSRRSSNNKNANLGTVTQSEDDVSKITGRKLTDTWQELREGLDSFSDSNIAMTHDEKESSELKMSESANEAASVLTFEDETGCSISDSDSSDVENKYGSSSGGFNVADEHGIKYNTGEENTGEENTREENTREEKSAISNEEEKTKHLFENLHTQEGDIFEADLFNQASVILQEHKDAEKIRKEEENEEIVLLRNVKGAEAVSGRSVSLELPTSTVMFSSFEDAELMTTSFRGGEEVIEQSDRSTQSKDFLSVLDDINIETDITSNFLRRSARLSGTYSPRRRQSIEFKTDQDQENLKTFVAQVHETAQKDSVRDASVSDKFPIVNASQSLGDIIPGGLETHDTVLDINMDTESRCDYVNESMHQSIGEVKAQTLEERDLTNEYNLENTHKKAVMNENRYQVYDEPTSEAVEHNYFTTDLKSKTNFEESLFSKDMEVDRIDAFFLDMTSERNKTEGSFKLNRDTDSTIPSMSGIVPENRLVDEINEEETERNEHLLDFGVNNEPDDVAVNSSTQHWIDGLNIENVVSENDEIDFSMDSNTKQGYTENNLYKSTGELKTESDREETEGHPDLQMGTYSTLASLSDIVAEGHHITGIPEETNERKDHLLDFSVNVEHGDVGANTSAHTIGGLNIENTLKENTDGGFNVDNKTDHGYTEDIGDLNIERIEREDFQSNTGVNNELKQSHYDGNIIEESFHQTFDKLKTQVIPTEHDSFSFNEEGESNEHYVSVTTSDSSHLSVNELNTETLKGDDLYLGLKDDTHFVDTYVTDIIHHSMDKLNTVETERTDRVHDITEENEQIDAGVQENFHSMTVDMNTQANERHSNFQDFSVDNKSSDINTYINVTPSDSHHLSVDELNTETMEGGDLQLGLKNDTHFVDTYVTDIIHHSMDKLNIGKIDRIDRDLDINVDNEPLHAGVRENLHSITVDMNTQAIETDSNVHDFDADNKSVENNTYVEVTTSDNHHVSVDELNTETMEGGDLHLGLKDDTHFVDTYVTDIIHHSMDTLNTVETERTDRVHDINVDNEPIHVGIYENFFSVTDGMNTHSIERNSNVHDFSLDNESSEDDTNDKVYDGTAELSREEKVGDGFKSDFSEDNQEPYLNNGVLEETVHHLFSHLETEKIMNEALRTGSHIETESKEQDAYRDYDGIKTGIDDDVDFHRDLIVKTESENVYTNDSFYRFDDKMKPAALDAEKHVDNESRDSHLNDNYHLLLHELNTETSKNIDIDFSLQGETKVPHIDNSTLHDLQPSVDELHDTVDKLGHQGQQRDNIFDLSVEKNVYPELKDAPLENIYQPTKLTTAVEDDSEHYSTFSDTDVADIRRQSFGEHIPEESKREDQIIFHQILNAELTDERNNVNQPDSPYQSLVSDHTEQQGKQGFDFGYSLEPASAKNEDLTIQHNDDLTIQQNEDLTTQQNEDLTIQHNEDLTIQHNEDHTIYHNEDHTIQHNEADIGDLNAEIQKQHRILSPKLSDGAFYDNTLNFDPDSTRSHSSSVSSIHTSHMDEHRDTIKETTFNSEFFTGSLSEKMNQSRHDSLNFANDNSDLDYIEKGQDGFHHSSRSDEDMELIKDAEIISAHTRSSRSSSRSSRSSLSSIKSGLKDHTQSTSGEAVFNYHVTVAADSFQALAKLENEDSETIADRFDVTLSGRDKENVNEKVDKEDEDFRVDISQNNYILKDQAVEAFEESITEFKTITPAHTVKPPSITSQEEESSKQKEDESHLFSKDKFQALRNVFEKQQENSLDQDRDIRGKRNNFKFGSGPLSPAQPAHESKGMGNWELQRKVRSFTNQVSTETSSTLDSEQSSSHIYNMSSDRIETNISGRRTNERLVTSSESGSDNDGATQTEQVQQKKKIQRNLSYDLQTGKLKRSSNASSIRSTSSKSSVTNTEIFDEMENEDSVPILEAFSSRNNIFSQPGSNSFAHWNFDAFPNNSENHSEHYQTSSISGDILPASLQDISKGVTVESHQISGDLRIENSNLDAISDQSNSSLDSRRSSQASSLGIEDHSLFEHTGTNSLPSASYQNSVHTKSVYSRENSNVMSDRSSVKSESSRKSSLVVENWTLPTEHKISLPENDHHYNRTITTESPRDEMKTDFTKRSTSLKSDNGSNISRKSSSGSDKEAELIGVFLRSNVRSSEPETSSFTLVRNGLSREVSHANSERSIKSQASNESISHTDQKGLFRDTRSESSSSGSSDSKKLDLSRQSRSIHSEAAALSFSQINNLATHQDDSRPEAYHVTDDINFHENLERSIRIQASNESVSHADQKGLFRDTRSESSSSDSSDSRKVDLSKQSSSNHSEAASQSFSQRNNLATHPDESRSDAYHVTDDSNLHALQEFDKTHISTNISTHDIVSGSRNEGLYHTVKGHTFHAINHASFDSHPHENTKDLYVDNSEMGLDNVREFTETFSYTQDSSTHRPRHSTFYTADSPNHNTTAKNDYSYDGGLGDRVGSSVERDNTRKHVKVNRQGLDYSPIFPSLLSQDSEQGQSDSYRTTVNNDTYFHERRSLSPASYHDFTTHYSSDLNRGSSVPVYREVIHHTENSQTPRFEPVITSTDAGKNYPTSTLLTNQNTSHQDVFRSRPNSPRVIDTAYDTYSSRQFSPVTTINNQPLSVAPHKDQDHPEDNKLHVTPVTITAPYQAVVGDRVGLHIDFSPTESPYLQDTALNISSGGENSQKRYVVKNIQQKNSLIKSSQHHSLDDSSSDIVFTKQEKATGDLNRTHPSVNITGSLSPRTVVDGPVYRVYQSPRPNVSRSISSDTSLTSHRRDDTTFPGQDTYSKSFSLDRNDEDGNLYRVRNLSTSVPDILNYTENQRGRSQSRSPKSSDSENIYRVVRRRPHSPERFFKNPTLSLRKEDLDSRDYSSEQEDSTQYRTVTKVYLNGNQPRSRSQSSDTHYKVSSLQSQGSIEKRLSEAVEKSEKVYEVRTVKSSDNTRDNSLELSDDDSDSGFQGHKQRYRIIGISDSSLDKHRVQAQSSPKLDHRKQQKFFEETARTRTESVHTSRISNDASSTQIHRSVIQLETDGNSFKQKKRSQDIQGPRYVIKRTKSADDLLRENTSTVIENNQRSGDLKMWRTGRSRSTDGYSDDADSDLEGKRVYDLSPRLVKVATHEDNNKRYVINSTLSDPNENHENTVVPSGWYKSTIDINQHNPRTLQQRDQYTLLNSPEQSISQAQRLNDQRSYSDENRTENTLYFARETVDKVHQRKRIITSQNSGQRAEVASSDDENEFRNKSERVDRIYEVRTEPHLPEHFQSMEDLSNDLRVLRGKILIQNRLDGSEHDEDDFDQNANLFDTSFHLGKDNPLYSSDPDIMASLRKEEQQEISKHVHQDITFETVDRIAHGYKAEKQDSTKAESTSDSISANGGFIAMAAGLSVVVPLICVLVMQLRRAKMEEREREGRRAAISGGENGAVDPPPSYEQVFGGDYSVLPVHSRNSSMDVLIEENETGRRNNGISGSQREAYVVIRGPSGIDGIDGGGGISDNSQVLQGPRLNPAFSDAPVATISGSRVKDLPVSLIVSQTGVPGADDLSSISGQGSLISNSSSQTTSGSSDSHTIQLSSLSLPSSSLVPSTSASTSLSPPPAPPPPAPPRSPPPPFSSWSFRNTSTNRNISTGTSNTSTNRNISTGTSNTSTGRNISAGISNIQETLRRFPGMHIAIEDFFASLRDLQGNVNEGPPPSYDEALKILESAALAKERKNIIT